MYSNILVPLDASKFSETVLPLVETLAKAASAKVTFVVVGEPFVEEIGYAPEGLGVDTTYAPVGLPPPLPDLDRHRTTLDQALQRFQDRGRTYLDAAARPLRSKGVAVEVEVLLGRVADRIAHYARDHNADLVAMATHGRTGLARLRYGSVANELTQRLEMPLLLMRPKEDSGDGGSTPPRIPRCLVVPLDGSSLAEQALPHARAIASMLGIEAHLIRVVGQPGLAFLEPDEAPIQGLEAERARAAGDYLQRVQGDLSAGGIKANIAVLHGQPAMNIVTYASGLSDSLICMTSHGRTGLGRFLLGSVADKVLREMPDSVYLVRARAQAA